MPETNLIEKLQTEFQGSTPKLGFSLEAMKLMVHLEKEARKQNGESEFNCFVIEAANLKDTLEEIKAMNPENQSKRIQLIIKNDGHYTSLDIKLSPEGNEVMLFDAAGDRRSFKYYVDLSNLKNEDGTQFFKNVYFPSEQKGIQKDSNSCPVFSFDHVCQSSRTDIFETIAQRNDLKDGFLGWSDLPPQFIWNTQSLAWLEEYTKKYPEAAKFVAPGFDMTFEQILDKSVQEVIINGQSKKGNVNVGTIFSNQVNRAQAYLENTNEETLKAIMQTLLTNAPKKRQS